MCVGVCVQRMVFKQLALPDIAWFAAEQPAGSLEFWIAVCTKTVELQEGTCIWMGLVMGHPLENSLGMKIILARSISRC